MICKCDICKELRPIYDTIILYNRNIIFCKKCKNKSKTIKNKMEKIINYYEKERKKQIYKLNLEKDNNIRIAEKNILKSIDKYY